jgi:hypothetical protein
MAGLLSDLEVGDIDFAEGTKGVTRSILCGVLGPSKTESSQKPVPFLQFSPTRVTEVEGAKQSYASTCDQRPNSGHFQTDRMVRLSSTTLGVSRLATSSAFMRTNSLGTRPMNSGTCECLQRTEFVRGTVSYKGVMCLTASSARPLKRRLARIRGVPYPPIRIAAITLAAFLCRLENEDDRSQKAFTHRGEYSCHSQNGSDMNFVTTGMGDSDILSVVGGEYCGLEWEGIFFGP